MIKQENNLTSAEPTKFEIALRNISVGKILKEQDEAAIITIIVGQIHRLVRLYQIPNLAHGADVELADWTYENYKYEPFDLVYSVLKNPPAIFDDEGKQISNWRLTPDTIGKWMKSALEKQAAKLEVEHHNAKWSDKDWSLMKLNSEAWTHIYDSLKLPGELAHKAKEDAKEMKKVRFSPHKLFNCDGYDVWSIDIDYAAMSFKEMFGRDPEKIDDVPYVNPKSVPSEQKQP